MRSTDFGSRLLQLRKACGGSVKGYDHGGPYTYEPPPKDPFDDMTWIEKILWGADMAPSVGPYPKEVPKAILKTLAGMLGTYNPDTNHIEAGMRPGLIDDIVGLPATVDSIAGLMGKETNLAGDTSKTAAALADASRRRIERVAPARSKGEAALQGVSDALVSVPGTQPAKLGKVAKAASVVPRIIYDTVVPVMDLSTSTGKAVAAGTAGLGAGLGAMGYGPEEDDVDFFQDLGSRLGAEQGADSESRRIDALIERAQGGDRAAYEELKTLFPGET